MKRTSDGSFRCIDCGRYLAPYDKMHMIDKDVKTAFEHTMDKESMVALCVRCYIKRVNNRGIPNGKEE